jgi:hypothetical protein
MRAALVTLALTALTVTAAPAAAAPSTTARREAGAHFSRGVSFFNAGDFLAAWAEFNAAYQAAPSPEVLYNVGVTECRLFRYGQAVKTLNRYLEESGKKLSRERRASVAAELEQLHSIAATVTVVVEGPAAEVVIDGEQAGTSPLAEPVLLGPGRHTFRAERAGARTDEQAVELLSGSSRELKLAPQAIVSPGPVAVSVRTAPVDAQVSIDGQARGLAPLSLELLPGVHDVELSAPGYASAHSDVLVLAQQPRSVTLPLGPPLTPSRAHVSLAPGAVLSVAGVATAALGGVFAVRAGDDSKAVQSSVTAGRWTAAAASSAQQGPRDQTLAWVLLGSGGALVAAGVVGVVISVLSGPAEPAPRVSCWGAPQAEGGFGAACVTHF